MYVIDTLSCYSCFRCKLPNGLERVLYKLFDSLAVAHDERWENYNPAVDKSINVSYLCPDSNGEMFKPKLVNLSAFPDI